MNIAPPTLTKADFKHYLMLELWTLDVASHLLSNTGFDDDLYRRRELEPVRKMRQLLEAAANVKALGTGYRTHPMNVWPDYVPYNVIAWALSKGLDTPDELRDFFNQAKPPQKPELTAGETAATETTRSDKLRALNQASALWDKANRDDKTTWSGIHEQVIAFLKKRGYTETLAKKGATIIRPDWVTPGRLPDE